jgi:hypothetical protein
MGIQQETVGISQEPGSALVSAPSSRSLSIVFHREVAFTVICRPTEKKPTHGHREGTRRFMNESAWLMTGTSMPPLARETVEVSYGLIRLNMKTNGKKSTPALAKGQLWSTKNGHIRIVELGKMLVHYKMLRDLSQMRRTQMSRIDNMVVYLKTNRAQLVENSAAAT